MYIYIYIHMCVYIYIYILHAIPHACWCIGRQAGRYLGRFIVAALFAILVLHSFRTLHHVQSTCQE